MTKTTVPERTINLSRLRLLALVAFGWIVFMSLLPDFILRLVGLRLSWLSNAAWAIGLLLLSGMAGYLFFRILRERHISRLILAGLVLLVISQGYRISISAGLFSIPAVEDWRFVFRALDNLFTGLGLVMVGFAIISMLITILDSRQQIMAKHADLLKEIERSEMIEKNLRERDVLLRGINTSALDGIIVMDTAGLVTYWNPAAERILGYTPEDIIGKPLHEILAPPRQRLACARGLAAWQTTGRGPIVGKTSTLKALAKNGDEVDVELSMSSMEIEGNWNAVGILRDITRRKRMEQEHKDLEAQLQYAQKLEGLGVLAGGIAHDFNNILQIILGNINMLERDVAVVEAAQKPIENLKRAVDRASTLTCQMLAYSGKRSGDLRVMDLGTVMGEMIAFLQASISKKVTVQTHCASDLPLIEVDPTQIEQVIMNLVLNAVEALDAEQGGVVKVSTTVRHCNAEYLQRSRALYKAPEGSYVCLEVADEGCGMGEETRERLFDPFFTTKLTGRGLGMSAVLGIMSAHKGAIIVESAPGMGTNIRACFPIASQPAMAAPKPEVKPPPATAQSPRTILIVDDEPDLLDIGSVMLQQLGYTVLTAADGLDAIEVFKSRHEEIDCVLLDLSMPNLDGIQTHIELRQIKPDVRVILASGYAEEDLEPRLAEHEICAFLAKPYDARILSTTLNKALA